MFQTWFACATLLAGASIGQAQSRNAWALDAQDGIYRFDGQWTPVGGLLRHISVSQDNNVWGVAGSETIWRWNGQGWDNMPGRLANIAVGAKGHVWGVASNDFIYRYNENLNTWDQMPGYARQVSVSSDGAVWVVTRQNTLFKWLGTDWQYIMDNTLQVAVGSVNNVWRIDGQNNLSRYNPASQPVPWDPAPGQLKQLSVAADGEMWGIDMSGQLVRRNGTAWEPQQKTYTEVSVGAALASTPSGGNTAPSGKIEEDNPAISYNGPWGRLPDGSASGGAYMVASQTGATMTVRFSGDTIVIYRRLDTDGGTFNVRIDNKDCGSFSSYFSERRWQVPAVLHGVGVGEHTLVLTLMADRPDGSSGTNVYIDALESPSPFVPTSTQQKGIDRLNAVRTQLGLPPARLAPAINLAAQAHADYMVLNPSASHEQTPGTPGFFGIDPSDRMQYYGYSAGGGEDIWPSQDGGQMVNAVLNSVYHRLIVVDYYATEVGFGTNSKNVGVFDVGYKYRPQPPASRLLVTYPADGQTGLGVRWDTNESPLPLPGKPRPLGTLLSLHITQPANAPKGTDTTPLSGTLRGDDGTDAPVYVLSPATDSNLGSGDFFLIPQGPLAYGTTYTATLAGTDEQGNAFSKTWKFSTIPASAITSTSGNVDGGGYTVYWYPAGDVVSTKLSWGPTTALGNDLPGQALGVVGYPSFYKATIPNLDAGTYYYQVTATDARGTVNTTQVTSFVMPTVTPSFAAMRAFAFAAGAVSVLFETTKPVASVSMDWGPTTSYGKTEAARLTNDKPNEYFVTLTGLVPGTYSYKLTAKDAGGNVVATSANQTFTAK